MNYACPHCHELLSKDPASGMLPAMCARCGGDIPSAPAAAADPPVPAAPEGDPIPAARSLASFLRWNRTQTGAAATPPVGSGSGSGSDAGGPAAPAEVQQEKSGNAAKPPVQDVPASAAAEPTDVPQDSVASELAETASKSDSPAAAREPLHEIEEEESAPDLSNPGGVDEPDAAPRPDASPPIDAPPPAPAPALPGDDPATPSFTFATRASTAAPRTPAWQWAALVVLALALVLQVLLADRARLAADAQWRPLLNSLCGVFGCSLPTWHEPDAFTMLSRDVRPSPQTPGALQVQATFRNDARWQQQWPVMRLSLSDADGRVVGTRAFVPSEYLEPALTQTTLAPGQSAQVMLQVREPQASVVAFSFDFD